MPATVPQRSGLALPVVRLNGGYLAARSAYDLAWSDLIVAAFCPVGGRVMRRNLGSTAPDQLMNPVDSFLEAGLSSAIQSAVATQCPHIRILDVAVKSTTRAQVEVSISFTLTNIPQSVETRLARLDRRMVADIMRISRTS